MFVLCFTFYTSLIYDTLNCLIFLFSLVSPFFVCEGCFAAQLIKNCSIHNIIIDDVVIRLPYFTDFVFANIPDLPFDPRTFQGQHIFGSICDRVRATFCSWRMCNILHGQNNALFRQNMSVGIGTSL